MNKKSYFRVVLKTRYAANKPAKMTSCLRTSALTHSKLSEVFLITTSCSGVFSVTVLFKAPAWGLFQIYMCLERDTTATKRIMSATYPLTLILQFLLTAYCQFLLSVAAGLYKSMIFLYIDTRFSNSCPLVKALLSYARHSI